MPEYPSGTVTFLFTDIEGSTHRWERDTAAMWAAVERHFALVRGVAETHGGVLFKTIGDAAQVAFPTAPNALSAALAAQQALAAEDWGQLGPMRVRMALHTGAATPQDGDYLAPCLNRLARLLATGHGGQILLSQATQQLVRDAMPAGAALRDLGEHRLRDLLEAERVHQLVTPGLEGDFPPLRSLDRQSHNLPAQLTPLVGREREVTEVRALLERPDVRLVTLTGPGGVGKTRLALQVAAEVTERFADGAWFVELEEATDEAQVVAAMARALGVREAAGQPPREAVVEFLATRALLLVLDNFEQVAHAAPLVGELLRAAPETKVLVSSRLRLGIRGEHESAVAPLGIPPRGGRAAAPEELGHYDAVRLFVARAQAAKSDFALTADNAGAVAEICRELDGLPLAIELAAARIKLLPPQMLLRRLEDRLGLLTGGARDAAARQQTLREAIAWSYDLLAAAEQTLFARLSVLAGGFVFEAAEAVANPGGDLDVLGGLSALVDQSLVRQEETPGGEVRFSMLATIRAYAREQLAAHAGDEVQLTQRRHAEHFLAVAEAAEPELTGPDQTAWLGRLGIEHDNVLAALAWLDQGGEGEGGLRIAGALWRFWAVRGFFTEGRHWLERALANRGGAAPAAVAKALTGAGFLAEAQGAGEQGIALLNEALALRRETGDQGGIADALVHLGNVHHYRGEHDRATRCYQEALQIAQLVGDRRTAANALSGLGDAALRRGDHDRAVELLEEGTALYRSVSDTRGAGANLISLGMLAVRSGKFVEGAALYQQSLEIWQALGDRPGTLAALLNLAEASHHRGDQETAAFRSEEALALARELGHTAYEAIALNTLGRVLVARGDGVQAQALFLSSVELGQKAGERETVADGLERLAAIAADGSQDLVAVRLFGAAAALRETIDAPLPEADRLDHDRITAGLRERLGPEGFAAAWSAGSSLTIEAAIAEAGSVAQRVAA